MEKNVITQTVCHQRIVLVVGLEGTPVVVEFLGTKHKHGLVAVFVIFDDWKCSEGFAETYGIGKDAAIILFEFIDDGKCSILLEIVKLVPNDAVLESRSLIGQNVFADVFKKLVENIVERDKVDEFGSILVIDRFDILQYLCCYILELIGVLPLFVKNLQVFLGERWWHDINHRINRIASLTAQFCCCKLIERHVCAWLLILDMQESSHFFLRSIGLKLNLSTNPVGTFFGNSFLF